MRNKSNMKKIYLLLLLSLLTSMSINALDCDGYTPLYTGEHYGRQLISFTLTDGAESQLYTINQSTDKGSSIYYDKTGLTPLLTRAGSQLSFSQLEWKGEWMSAYLYIDYDRDGYYDSEVNADGTETGELVSFSFYSENEEERNPLTGVNSLGTTVKFQERITPEVMPAFILPENLSPGSYKCLLKIDWNSLNPCGNEDPLEDIGKNDGCLVEFKIKIPYEGEFTIKAPAELTVETGQEMVVPVSIDTEMMFEYAGFQFDIDMPDGLTLEKIELGNAMSGFTGRSTSAKTRTFAYRLDGGSSTVTNDIVNLTVRASEDATLGSRMIVFSNVVFSSPEGTEIDFGESSANVEVTETDLLSVSVTAAEGRTTITDTEKLQLTAKYNNTPSIPSVTWDSSRPDVATVSPQGLVTGVSQGITTITATVSNSVSTARASIDITVTDTPAKTITITPAVDTHVLKTMQTLSLSCVVSPGNTTYPDHQWESSDDDVATVSPDGVVTAVKAGQVTITARVTRTPSVTATYDLTVEELIPGDANNNGVVNVADVVTIANHIVEKTILGYADMFAADLDHDGTVDVSDLNGVVNMIMGEEVVPATAARNLSTSTTDRLVTDYFAVSDGGDATVIVRLENTIGYSSLQASIIPPAGMTVLDVKPGSRIPTHDILYNITDDGTVKLVIFSLSNQPIVDIDGSLFEMRVSTNQDCGDLTIDGIIGATPSCRRYELEYDGDRHDTGSDTILDVTGDGITVTPDAEGITVSNAEGLAVDVYSVDGRQAASLVVASSVQRIRLEHGIYLVTVNGTTKKVLVK